jgi:hypothetical protein
MRRSSLASLGLVASLLLAGCGKPDAAAPPPSGQTPAAKARTLEWDDLIPRDFRPDKLLERYNVNEMSDNDPRAKQLMEELKALWKEAPVVADLQGQTVRLPGFVVPLEGDGTVVHEFLLVPYYGACIHVPPPPANQTVYVVTQGKDAKIRGLFDTVWVIGVMKIERTNSELAEAGYKLEALDVRPYND